MKKQITITPLKVKILLHYWLSSYDYENMDASMVKEAHDELIEAGILYLLPVHSQNNKTIGCVQDALNVYVDELIKIPLPSQKWVCEK